MTPALRKRHLRMWILLAVLLPIGFISAFLAKPYKIFDQAPKAPIPEAFEEILRFNENETMKVNLRAKTVSSVDDSTNSSPTLYQIEFILKKPLTTPSTLIYLGLESGNESVENKLLLGKLGQRGIYRFELKGLSELPQTIHLILHDGIKKQTFNTLTL